jgi:hypothetical protein
MLDEIEDRTIEAASLEGSIKLALQNLTVCESNEIGPLASGLEQDLVELKALNRKSYDCSQFIESAILRLESKLADFIELLKAKQPEVDYTKVTCHLCLEELRKPRFPISETGDDKLWCGNCLSPFRDVWADFGSSKGFGLDRI